MFTNIVHKKMKMEIWEWIGLKFVAQKPETQCLLGRLHMWGRSHTVGRYHHFGVMSLHCDFAKTFEQSVLQDGLL
jgi:hypothetical protein